MREAGVNDVPAAEVTARRWKIVGWRAPVDRSEIVSGVWLRGDADCADHADFADCFDEGRDLQQ
jgi:hypothetical protein